jgi:hypothetical protein
MCIFESDDEDTNDVSADESGEFSQGGFLGVNPEDELHEHVLFDVSVNTHQLLLASALIGMTETLKQAQAIIEAAWMMRENLFLKAVTQSEESRQWNECHEVGTVVQYYPNGRNVEETYLGRTSSPSIDTQSGPVVLIEGHKSAVSLLNVTPRKTTSPEVLP